MSSGLLMKYFVLKPYSGKPRDRYAKASRDAMRAYADSIESKNKTLAASLRRWATKSEATDE